MKVKAIKAPFKAPVFKPQTRKPPPVPKPVRKTVLGRPGGPILAGRVKNPQPPKSVAKVSKALGGHSLESKTAGAYKRLVAEARKAGFKAPLFSVKSGLRTDQRQAELFKDALAKYKTVAKARKWVAPPGQSVHRSGRAIDFDLGVQNKKANVDRQRDTKAWQWLRKNAPRFGFNPYRAEPWHWEYNVKQRGKVPKERSIGPKRKLVS